MAEPRKDISVSGLSGTPAVEPSTVGQLRSTPAVIRAAEDWVDRTIQAATGAAISLAEDPLVFLFRSAGHLVQRCRARGFYQGLREAVEKLCDAGRIPPEYTDTEQHRECLQEVLNVPEDPGCSEEHFRWARCIFLAAATASPDEWNSVLPAEFLALIRTLSRAELLILGAAHSLATSGAGWRDMKARADWAKEIADQSGLRHPQLVLNCGEHLNNLGIIDFVAWGVGSGARFGLKELGWALCEYVARFEDEAKEESSGPESTE